MYLAARHFVGTSKCELSTKCSASKGSMQHRLHLKIQTPFLVILTGAFCFVVVIRIGYGLLILFRFLAFSIAFFIVLA